MCLRLATLFLLSVSAFSCTMPGTGHVPFYFFLLLLFFFFSFSLLCRQGEVNKRNQVYPGDIHLSLLRIYYYAAVRGGRPPWLSANGGRLMVSVKKIFKQVSVCHGRRRNSWALSGKSCRTGYWCWVSPPKLEPFRGCGQYLKPISVQRDMVG